MPSQSTKFRIPSVKRKDAPRRTSKKKPKKKHPPTKPLSGANTYASYYGFNDARSSKSVLAEEIARFVALYGELD